MAAFVHYCSSQTAHHHVKPFSCQVWRSGLSQTYQHLQDEEEQELWKAVFSQEAVNAADPEHGDLGTKQVNHWQSTPGKSEFFVAAQGVAR